MYVKDGVTYASGDEYADMLCARGEAEMYAQSNAIAGYELALAQATAMIERQADEIARLRDENAKLRDEIEECDALRTKLADILTRTANALKGEPEPLHLHSWHDLPECAQGLREDAARYRLVRRGQHWSVIDGIGGVLRADALDAAIDAARKGE